jgi:hypothetical protein
MKNIPNMFSSQVQVCKKYKFLGVSENRQKLTNSLFSRLGSRPTLTFGDEKVEDRQSHGVAAKHIIAARPNALD